jgi:Periplasmic protein involved in polysaccharide export
MPEPMHKIRKHFFVRVLCQFLITLLLNSILLTPAMAQQSRRGLFMQDDVPSQGKPDSFGERNGEEPEEPEITEPGMGMDGMPGGQGRPGMGSAGMMDRGLIYQVHVLGEVKRPGTYRVNPSMRVTDALRQAGNIKSNGSERYVELRKQGQSHGRVIDLFAYKTFGNLSQNPYLQDNDTIYIPLKRMAIEIEGPVRRPGIFELKTERSIQDVVKLAGGFTVGVSQKEPIKVIRYGGYEEKEILEIPTTEPDIGHFMVQDGDVIVVPHKFLTQHQFDYNLKKLPNDNIFYPSYEDRVFVIGAVRAPGAFDFNQYYSLRQYLTLAGGTTTMAKNGKISVVTADGKSFKAKNGTYDRVVNPGDTIIVPEKSIPNSFYIGLLPTIASLGLSAAALFR